MNGTRIRAYMQNLVQNKGIPYLDFALSIEDKQVFRYCVGRDGVTGKEDLFLWSCSKPLTVVGVMKLVEKGKLGLDDEVEKYIPEFGRTFLQNGERTTKKMTVRHLLTMSGGLTYNLDAPPIRALREKTGNAASTREIVAKFVETPLLFEPGERFEYSLCHDVLAVVVESVSGKRFAEYMDEEIFAPLGMRNTRFHGNEDNLAASYAVEKGKIQRGERKNGLVVCKNYDSGGAGVMSCVDDYAKFARALACGGAAENGYRLIKEETLLQIRKPHFKSVGVESGFTCIQGDDYGYGLGMRTRVRATDWGLPVGEFGWDGAAGSYLMIDPTRKISVVMGMHLLNWPEIFRGEHLNLVKAAYADMEEENI